MKDAEHLALHSGVLRRAGQGLELFGGLLAQFQPLHVGGGLIAQLLAARLDCEILLRMRDLGFARVAILGDQVAGEAGEVVVLYLALAAGAEVDHIAGAGKMVCWVVARGLARDHGSLDGLFKAPPLAVPQHWLQVSRAPVFGAVFVVLLERLERLRRCRLQIGLPHRSLH